MAHATTRARHEPAAPAARRGRIWMGLAALLSGVLVGLVLAAASPASAALLVLRKRPR